MKTPALFALLVGAAMAQTVVESSSFGYNEMISPNRYSIPGWKIGGEGHVPRVLSDKLVITPPYPGNTRGFAWSESPLSQPGWIAELQFRASGQERGGGNLQLWYAKDGQAKVGSSSIYTVGQFDGFALVIDTHSGRGGTVRGFLNDGTTDYKTHASVDSLAFGHCEYSYRNLGRPSVIQLKNTGSVFEVTVDDKLCFTTDRVILAPGNTFGLTAATPENPDTFEIFKFVVRTSEVEITPGQQQQEQQQHRMSERSASSQADGTRVMMEQFIDLGTKLQLINQATSNIIRELNSQASKVDTMKMDLLQQLTPRGQVAALDARLQRMEQALDAIKRDLESKDFKGQLSQLQEVVRSSHKTLAENLHGTVFDVITASKPRMGLFIFIIIAVQILLALSYVIYKRRRVNMPKKYL